MPEFTHTLVKSTSLRMKGAVLAPMFITYSKISTYASLLTNSLSSAATLSLTNCLGKLLNHIRVSISAVVMAISLHMLTAWLINYVILGFPHAAAAESRRTGSRSHLAPVEAVAYGCVITTRKKRSAPKGTCEGAPAALAPSYEVVIFKGRPPGRAPLMVPQLRYWILLIN